MTPALALTIAVAVILQACTLALLSMSKGDFREMADHAKHWREKYERALRTVRLLRPPAPAELIQWARYDCAKCRGKGWTQTGACACLEKSKVYQKARDEGRVVVRQGTPWVAETAESESEAA